MKNMAGTADLTGIWSCVLSSRRMLTGDITGKEVESRAPASFAPRYSLLHLFLCCRLHNPRDLFYYIMRFGFSGGMHRVIGGVLGEFCRFVCPMKTPINSPNYWMFHLLLCLSLHGVIIQASSFWNKTLRGVVTFNLVFLISKPLKILINSCQPPGGTLLISEVPFMLVH